MKKWMIGLIAVLFLGLLAANIYISDELKDTRTELENQKTYYENRLVEEFQNGKGVGYKEALEREVPLRNPTYEEAMSLAYRADYLGAYREKTKAGKKFVCLDYVEVLNKAANAAGIRSGVVFLVFRDILDGKWGHFLNCFDTVDRGRVYFDPFYGEEIMGQIEEGKSYYGDMIKEIIIYW
jgi:hypothetical protein